MLSKILTLDQLSCPQIWNKEIEKDKEKEKIGDRPAKLNEKKSDGELEREMKSHSLLKEQHEIEAGVREREMLTATKEKMSGGEKKKVNKNMYDISSIKRVTRKFLNVARCSRVKQRQKMCKKSVLQLQSCFFFLIRPTVVFSPFSLPFAS